MKMIDAVEFEKDVRRVLDEVQATGEQVAITVHGVSVAIVNAREAEPAEPLPPLFGMLKRDGYSFPDPFSPNEDLWEEAFDRKWDEKLT